ncbi:MAG: hypothetical protein IJH07_04655 [Ruminococcus sp.]|nr:hypothetical protein [Ruminococcus sp.]
MHTYSTFSSPFHFLFTDHFYDIPEWAGDEYVFAGWYYKEGFAESDDFDSEPPESNVQAVNFETQTYPKTSETDPQDYHIYAKWIEVGTVSKDKKDVNIISGDYRGFGLAGVQIRDPAMFDTNYNENKDDENDRTPGGMRFVTSLSESLLKSIDDVSDITVHTDEGDVGVEYGYAVGTESNIKTFLSHYEVTDTSSYKLQYRGSNVNGVNTDPDPDDPELKEISADNDFRYITNVNCTRGTTNTMGTIKDDHRNFTNYRLYTLVVTYEGADKNQKNAKIDARAYIRYYDANGKLRVFYNDYRKNMYYGGCLCSYNQVSSLAIPQNAG